MGTTSSNNLLNLHFYCCEKLECFPLFKKHFYYCIPCFSASTFELTDAVYYISLFIFVNAVLHMLTEWLSLPMYNVCTLLASTRPPLSSCHMCKCCTNRPLLELIPGSATGNHGYPWRDWMKSPHVTQSPWRSNPLLSIIPLFKCCVRLTQDRNPADMFVWLWLIASAYLLRLTREKYCWLASGWCWIDEREKYCWLIGWQDKRTEWLQEIQNWTDYVWTQ